MNIVKTPPPPYYVVVFTSIKSDVDKDYLKTSQRLNALLSTFDGFLGVEDAYGAINLSVSYWKDLASIARWKQDIEHLQAQKRGREEWYSAYKVRIAKVERDYAFEKSRT